MADHHSYQRVVTALTERINQFTSDLIAGGPDRHEVTRGQILGLSWAKKTIVEEAKKNFEEVE